jgi:hypothetical protein
MRSLHARTAGSWYIDEDWIKAAIVGSVTGPRGSLSIRESAGERVSGEVVDDFWLKREVTQAATPGVLAFWRQLPKRIGIWLEVMTERAMR